MNEKETAKQTPETQKPESEFWKDAKYEAGKGDSERETGKTDRRMMRRSVFLKSPYIEHL